ncbi:MAG: ribbon-helix-helix protein, CopG family [Rhizobiales bacterium]|nr:ribbon-helix-helix protein, CopG family [Hyphomicrobiales bacterium]
MDIILQNLGGDMTERPRKATRLTVSLEEQDYRMLNEIAVARDASLSWVIRQAIRQFIENTPKAQDKQKAPHGGRTGGDR